MRRFILSLFLGISFLIGGLATQSAPIVQPFIETHEALAAGCGASVTSFYKSGSTYYANASFWCSGASGTGKLTVTVGGNSPYKTIFVPSSGAVQRLSVSAPASTCYQGAAKYAYATVKIGVTTYHTKSVLRCP